MPAHPAQAETVTEAAACSSQGKLQQPWLMGQYWVAEVAEVQRVVG
jgi:hypothetical protein